MKSQKNVYLYFWKNDKNIGDYTSFYVIQHLSSDKIIYKNPFINISNIIFNFIKSIIGKSSHTLEYMRDYIFPWNNIVFGVGSILDFAPSKSAVWGSGFREYESKTKATEIYAVRGYLSKKLLKYNDNIKIGDPALLLPKLYPIKKKMSKNLGIIPHYKEVEIFASLNRCGYDIIDTRTEDVEAFINKITNYQYILSSSLHGVIIAHAYGIKALWIQHGDVGSSSFKYFDYFSSVGIDDYPDLDASKVINLSEEEISLLFEKYKKQSLPQCDLELIQSSLINCAPFNVRESYK